MELLYILLGITAFAASSNAVSSNAAEMEIDIQGIDVTRTKAVGKDYVFLLANQTNITLNCTVKYSEPNSTIAWLYDSNRLKSLDIKKEQQQVLRKDPYTVSQVLTIMQVKEKSFEEDEPMSCVVFKGGARIEKEVTFILAKEVNFTKDDLTSDKILSCAQNLSSRLDVTWKKMNDDGKLIEVTELTEGNKYSKTAENSLRISKPNREFAGLYFAEFRRVSDIKYVCPVYYFASPLVLAFEKSRNLIEEEDLELKCSVIGFPKTSVKWFKDGTEIKKGGRISFDKYKGHPDASLTIKKVMFEEAGMYNCTSCDDAGECSSKEVTVRVKDKLAALWPFLGIVAEVVVLCAIIFFYERRRNKQADQAELDAQDNADNAADNVEGLRHRNTTNNPRA